MSYIMPTARNLVKNRNYVSDGTPRNQSDDRVSCTTLGVRPIRT